MSNGKEIQLPSGAASPDRLGQATAVEQSRAIAEVQGAIIVAQKVPRNVAAATTAMEESCGQKYLAEKAFFSFKRGGGTVAGTSVYLARELARCWGNVQYGVAELRRDDVHGQSEMMAYAWDVQTNTRVETKFIVPHMRDKTGGPVKLTDMRDIYESNANAGARRVRECIINILPPWFVDTAKELCQATLRDGGGVPMQKRVAATIANFAKLGVTQQQLEKKQGRGSNAWTEMDIAQLHVLGRSLQNGEIERDEAFEPDIPSVGAFGDPAPASKPAEPSTNGAPVSVPEAPADDEQTDTPHASAPESAPPSSTGPKARRAQVTALATMLKDNGVESEEDQLAVISLLVDYPVASLSGLVVDEVTYLYNRIPELVKGGDFAGTIERARQAAAR